VTTTNTLNELDECLSITHFLNLACITIMGEEARNLPKNSREVSGAQLCFFYLQDKLEGAIKIIEGEKL
jgi:hypothetical protein